MLTIKKIFFRCSNYIVIVSPAILCVIASMLFGKDVNFDAINYHAYAPFSLLEGRINTDFFAAGPQSYLNPVGYIPFHFLMSWLSDSSVSFGLALLHSASLYGLIYLTGELIDKNENPWVYYLSIILGLLTSVFWQIVGSSFIDGYVCTLVLFGLFFLIRWSKKPLFSHQYKNLIFSAAFFGIAAGIKLTAIIFALAAGSIVFWHFLMHRGHWKALLIFTCIGLSAFLLVEGWWAYSVFKKTGNPFFPYFNNIFSSPYYPSLSISNARFIPESFLDGLLFPLKAIMPLPWLYQELRAPDIRFFCLFLALVTVLIFRWEKIRASPSSITAIIFFVISYLLWMLTSGNGRYGIPLFLIVGLLVSWGLTVLFSRSMSKNILLGLVFIQCFLLYVGGSFRWSSEPFSNDWFGYKIPVVLQERPALYLTQDANSFSFLSSKVHSKSIFMNLSGQLPLPLTGKLQGNFLHAMEDVSGEIRFITMALLNPQVLTENEVLPSYNGYGLLPRLIYVMNARFSRFGFEVDETDCQYIEPELGFKSIAVPLLVSCKLKYNPTLIVQFEKESAPYDLVYNAIELKCPKFFNPKKGITEKFGDLWMRRYLGSEVKMYVSGGSVWLEFSDRILPINLGYLKSLALSVDSISCENTVTRVSDDIW